MPITASSRAGFPRTGNSFLSTTLPDYNRVIRSTDIFANTMDARIKNSLETLAREAAANEEPMYVVGGTLRDALIDRDTHDLDLTCANARQWAEGFARSNRSRCVTLHGEPGEEVYRVPLGKEFFCDFGTLRGNHIEDDLAHRDFTINAMAQPLTAFLEGSAEMIDLYQGREDIKNRVIRLLPGTPIEDDPLRMLRAFRLAALLGFEMEPGTLDAIRKLCGMMARVSGERVSQELLKLFGTPDPRADLLANTGLLAELRTGAGLQEADLIDAGTVYKRGQQWWDDDAAPLSQHRESYKNYFAQGEHRALFGISGLVVPRPAADIDEVSPILFKENLADKFMQHYRFSNQQRHWVAACCSLASLFIGLTRNAPCAPPSPSQMFRWCQEHGPSIVPALFMALMAHPQGDDPPRDLKVFLETLYDFHANRYIPASKLEPLLTGNDLMETFNLRPSPLFKTILNRLEEARVLGDIQTREQAETLTRTILDNPAANGLP